MIVQKGRIRTPQTAEEYVRALLQGNPVEVIPIDQEIAILSRTLAFEHEDPADRFIAATAFRLGCPLATVDPRLRKLRWLKVI